MLKKIMIALVAVVSLGAAATTSAAARGWRGGRGFYRGGFYGGGFGRGFGYRGYAYPAYGYGYGAYGCWRTVRVFTPYGPRWRRVWVCG